jgi:hypothetical protein
MAVLGCQTLIGADFGSAHLAPASAPEGCTPKQPPKRPADLPPAGDSVDFTVVIDQLDFGDEAPDAGAKSEVGYDLDGLCTTKSGPPSCRQASWLDQAPAVDGPDGRDDGVGNLFKAQRMVLPGGALIGTTEENQGLVSGTTAPVGVLRITGYAGFGSDDHVVVELFQAAPFNATPHGAGSDGGSSPRFDASDQWPIARETLVDKDGDSIESTQRDDAAFVIGNQLVANFDTLKLPMHNVYVDVSKATLTGDLHHDLATGQWTLMNGTLVGRIETKSLLAFAPLATITVVHVALCKDDPLNYDKVKRFMCQSADLPAIDGDPKSACTFTSFGMNFQTSPASLGPVVDVAPLPDPCPPNYDPAKDTCEFEFQQADN